MEQAASNSDSAQVLRELYNRLLQREQALIELSAHNTSLSLSPDIPFYINQLARMQDYCLLLEASYGVSSNKQDHQVTLTRFSRDVERIENSLIEFLLPWS